MNRTEIVFEYHERTKHHPNRYAASLGYMDWATQPNPFRIYNDTPKIKLPLIKDDGKPEYERLFDLSRKSEPLSADTLAQMLQYSLGLAAWKRIGNDSWALRCNASSGNLHPTEATLILPPIDGISSKSSVAHYMPKEHGLELLATFDTDFWSTLPEGSFLLGISSIIWREAWKYGERAFRYTQLDAGHAMQAVTVGSALNAWRCSLLTNVEIETIDRLLGLDQPHRFIPEEKEISEILLCIGSAHQNEIDLSSLLDDIPSVFHGKANQLSPSHHPWEAIDLIEHATHTGTAASGSLKLPYAVAELGDRSAKKVILQRRSAQAMDFGRAHIGFESFMQLLQSVQHPFVPSGNVADFILFVHDVASLERGLYYYCRNAAHINRLQHLCRKDLIWEPVTDALYLLEKGDFRAQAKFISCSQDIASEGAFSLGMLCEFEPQITTNGAQRYKELFWECGAIGQQLYLNATALGLNATGIGCYLDDVMHRMLGLTTDEFQTLYHFTIGRAIVDMRITTLPPYHNI